MLRGRPERCAGGAAGFASGARGGEALLDAGADALSCRQYSSQADDGSLSEGHRHAALLCSIAEGHLEDEDGAQASKAARDAAEAFRQLGGAPGAAAGLADALRLLCAGQRLCGEFGVARDTAEKELGAFRAAGDRHGEAAMLLALSDVHLAQGSYIEASEKASAAQGVCRASGDASLETASLLALARARLSMEMPGEALSFAGEAVAVSQRLGDDQGHAAALRTRSASHLAGGAIDEALRASAAALALLKASKSRKGQAYESEMVAHLHLQRRRPNEALAAAREAEALFRELGCSAGERLAASAIVGAHLLRGEAAFATSIASQALQRFRAAGRKRDEASMFADTLVQVHLAQDNVAEAIAAAEEALALCRSLGDKQLEARTLDNISSLHAMRQQHEEALRVGGEAVDLFASIGDLRGEAGVCYKLSSVQHLRADHREALRLAGRSRELLGRAGCRASEVSAILAESFSQQLLGDLKVARTLVDEAIAKAQATGDARPEALGLLSMVTLHMANPGGVDWDTAYEVAKKAESILRKLTEGSADDLLAYALQLQSVVCLHLQQLDMAARAAHEAHVLYVRAADKAGESEILRLLVCVDLEILFRDLRGAKDDPKLRQAILRRQAGALRNAERSVALAKQCAAPSSLADCLQTLAQIRSACSQGPQGVAAAEEAAKIFRDLGEKSREASALVTAADACVVAGDRPGAVDMASRASSLFEELGDEGGQQMARQVLQGSDQAPPLRALGAPEPPAASVVEEPRALPTLELTDALRIAKEVAVQAIGEADEVDFDSPLMDIGLDSLAAISFREALASASGITLPTSLVFDYPSLQAVAQHLVEASAEAPRKR